MKFAPNPSEDSTSTAPPKVTQLYERVELYTAGEPPQNTLFILGGPQSSGALQSQLPLSLSDPLDQDSDELLLIDPPEDAAERFQLDGRVAALHTVSGARGSLPQIRTEAGGIAHIRIGEHFLDIYSFRGSNVVHVPALGMICSGPWGSDTVLPLITEGSFARDELDILKLLASLIKSRHFQLLIPSRGTVAQELVSALRRLAEDVDYIHSMRRVVQAMVSRGNELEAILALSDSLLPRRAPTPLSEEHHLLNLQTLYLDCTHEDKQSQLGA